jgi:hypothetical protein
MFENLLASIEKKLTKKLNGKEFAVQEISETARSNFTS